jgi:hypothetical protein
MYLCFSTSATRVLSLSCFDCNLCLLEDTRFVGYCTCVLIVKSIDWIELPYLSRAGVYSLYITDIQSRVYNMVRITTSTASLVSLT